MDENNNLRAWLRRACNALDATGDEHARQWAAAIREETEPVSSKRMGSGGLTSNTEGPAMSELTPPHLVIAI